MSKELICEAITQRRIITFQYKNALRTVEPYTVGYDKKNTLTLKGWQLNGGSDQDWRAYHLTLLTGVTITDAKFAGTRPDYNPNDQTMRIICRI